MVVSVFWAEEEHMGLIVLISNYYYLFNDTE